MYYASRHNWICMVHATLFTYSLSPVCTHRLSHCERFSMTHFLLKHISCSWSLRDSFSIEAYFIFHWSISHFSLKHLSSSWILASPLPLHTASACWADTSNLPWLIPSIVTRRIAPPPLQVISSVTRLFRRDTSNWTPPSTRQLIKSSVTHSSRVLHRMAPPPPLVISSTHVILLMSYHSSHITHLMNHFISTVTRLPGPPPTVSNIMNGWLVRSSVTNIIYCHSSGSWLPSSTVILLVRDYQHLLSFFWWLTSSTVILLIRD